MTDSIIKSERGRGFESKSVVAGLCTLKALLKKSLFFGPDPSGIKVFIFLDTENSNVVNCWDEFCMKLRPISRRNSSPSISKNYLKSLPQK